MNEIKRLTVRSFRKMKRDGEIIVMLTAYDAPTARFAAGAGVDLILVGDSLGMTALGYDDTVPVTMDDMILHCKAVRRGAPNTFIVGDMPFMSYHISVEDALRNAARFMQEAACDCVKLECGRDEIPLVRRMVAAGIPVCAHIGLLPQSVKVAGGYRVAGRREEEADALVADALALQEAGAFMIVLECLPRSLAERITGALEVPTIGIGAGTECDGQVQVFCDMLGISEFTPKHAKHFAEAGAVIRQGIEAYVADVKAGRFPADENSFE